MYYNLSAKSSRVEICGSCDCSKALQEGTRRMIQYCFIQRDRQHTIERRIIGRGGGVVLA
jgi:hypothetical protein